MTKIDTISIEDQAYDALTGLPVTKTTPVASQKVTVSRPTVATNLHSGPQHSVTLRRQSLQKPVPAKRQIIGHPQVKHMDISRPKHTNVQHFAPHPAGALNPTVSRDISPVVVHPHVAKAHARSEAKQSLTHSLPTASEVKDRALKKAVEGAHKRQPLRSRMKSQQRVVAILSATLAIVLLGGYVTYLNMPALSVRVAAAQAGIDAGYPNYRPDGYALNGPVTYSQGEVAMNFKANGGNQTFTLSQSKSGWDSAALLDNYATPKAGSDYTPYTERGLTIYTYGDNAAWVNGGMLYTIQGNAPLSSTQMREIATSLL